MGMNLDYLAHLNKQQRTLDILSRLRELLSPEVDALLFELEDLTDRHDEIDEPMYWSPSDAEGQAVKEGAFMALCAINEAIRHTFPAMDAIREVFDTVELFKEKA